MLNPQQHRTFVLFHEAQLTAGFKCSHILQKLFPTKVQHVDVTNRAALLSQVLSQISNGGLLFTCTAHPLHLMEKPCHVSQDLVNSAAPHAQHESAVVKHWETWPILHGVVYLWPRPDPGLMSVNTPHQPGGAVHGAEIKDLSSTAGTAASLSHNALWFLHPSLKVETWCLIFH